MNQASKITVGGESLGEFLNKEKSREIGRVHREEAGRFLKARRNRGGKPKMADQKPRPGDLIEYTDARRFAYCVEKGGGPKMIQWLKQPEETQQKQMRLYAVLRQLPDEFMSQEVAKTIKEYGHVSDYHRILHMFAQGSFLVREDKPRNAVWSKTDLAKLETNQLAAAIHTRSEAMVGHANRVDKAEESARRKRRRLQKMKEKVQRIESQLIPATKAPVELPAAVEANPAPAPLIMMDAADLSHEAKLILKELEDALRYKQQHLNALPMKDFVIAWASGLNDERE